MNVGGDSGPGGGKSQDFDINLAPIIDCFTVLITFMLVTASFLAVGIFDTSVAVSGPPSPNAKPPSVRLDIELTEGKEIQIRVTGKAKLEKKIAARTGEWDTAALIQEVEDIKTKWPDTQSFVLSASDDIQYVHIVRIMEVMKSHLPTVLLGGL